MKVGVFLLGAVSLAATAGAAECGKWGSGSSGPTHCAHRNDNYKDRETFCNQFAGRGSWKEACRAGGKKCHFEYQGSGMDQQMCWDAYENIINQCFSRQRGARYQYGVWGIPGHCFESTPYTPWEFKPTYVKQGTASIVTGGYKSSHAIQFGATSGYQEPTSYNKFYQTFKICKASRFQLSWSMLLPKNGAQYTAPYKPGIFVRKLQMVSGIRWDRSLLRPAFSAAPSSRQVTKTGTWTISMEWYLNGPSAAGGKTSTLRLKMDNFAVKPK
ncbi:hypothetical protein LB507_004194 [Fusarium sp. FIESC RH6]|nr:hypothetical protein LB507_004194 [Fusarium sp. FIESC RH6]